mmetsp:Transcript_16938/g.50773  ORF Transcript_16938/g.50773 Transcript_16938/m.50773 type:complete len:236 (-) Transcript_16938:743-1450(-)
MSGLRAAFAISVASAPALSGAIAASAARRRSASCAAAAVENFAAVSTSRNLPLLNSSVFARRQALKSRLASSNAVMRTSLSADSSPNRTRARKSGLAASFRLKTRLRNLFLYSLDTTLPLTSNRAASMFFPTRTASPGPAAPSFRNSSTATSSACVSCSSTLPRTTASLCCGCLLSDGFSAPGSFVTLPDTSCVTGVEVDGPPAGELILGPAITPFILSTSAAASLSGYPPPSGA